MRPTLHFAIIACAFGVAPKLSGQPIRPTVEHNDMRLVVSYVSTGELLNLQAKYGGARPDRHYVRQSHRRGFSLLRRHRETGALTCEIYLSNEQRPREVDDEATLSLGHELLHCMLGDYHR
ncbi:MAG TPA: hypothetical protein VFL84_01850 [Gammaproteobacteria bacterium]|nr:hypothetical protein [Gammaproteobacteria bacterium]